ncbi:MAG: transposase, partial [Aquifex sp.]
MHISVEVEKPEKVFEGKNYASIDLGVRNLIVLAIYDKDKKLIRVYQFKSRELWKEYKYWDRKIAEYQSKLSKSGHKGKSVKLRKLYEK